MSPRTRERRGSCEGSFPAGRRVLHLDLRGTSLRSGSAKMMSSAMIDGADSCSRAIRRPITSRRQGHWPIVDKLRSSTSTMTTRFPCGLVGIDRSRASYAKLSSRTRRAGRYTAKSAAKTTGMAPLTNTRRRWPAVLRDFGGLDNPDTLANVNSVTESRYLTEISTRRLRGSAVSSAV